jgi:mRNA interferase YafQ
MRKAKLTAQFEKDVKRVEKRGYEMRRLSVLIAALVREEMLDPRYKDHPLKGNYAGMRECHIAPDWLLIYQADKDTVFLTRTGSHADLFK